MKILIVSGCFYPTNAPRAFRTTELVKEFGRLGHSVRVYFPENNYNYSEFIKKHRLNNFVLEDFQEQVRDAVSRYVKSVVTNAPAENNIPVVQLESKISMINDSVEYDVKERLGEEFGVEVSSVDIGKIELDKASDGYK